MRATTLTALALLVALGGAAGARSALAQQQDTVPPPDQSATVPQGQLGAPAQAGNETLPQPRFVRVPGAGGIEVSPLAPPAGAEPTGMGQVGTGQVGTGQDGFGQSGTPQDGTVLDGTAQDGTVLDGTAAAAGQEQGPIFLRPGDDATLIEQGGGADTLDRSSERASVGPDDGETTIRQRRFKLSPDRTGPNLRPLGPAVPIDAPATQLRKGVRLRELDKMTGQTETFEIAVGETRQVDRLKIRLEACRSPETNDTHGTMAFLKVWDIRQPEDEAFSGWMFAEAPSLSAIDHPRYDVWVISCTTATLASATPPVQAAEPADQAAEQAVEQETVGQGSGQGQDSPLPAPRQ